ncbi:MAG TPA: hypothetical protein VIK54_07240 [Acidimicrobiia bacterium]
MNREPARLVPALLDWLVLADPEPGDGWAPEPPLAELQCSPDLVARLAEIARPIGGVRRRFVAGCPVIQHPRGRPIAAAAGASWLAVRSGMPAGALRTGRPRTPRLDTDWVEVDPWAADAAFARTVDLLCAHVARAYARAEADA